MKRILGIFSTAALALAILGCASAPLSGGPTLGAEEVRYGQIVRIDPMELSGDRQLGLGAVIGAAAGGLLANNIGRGTGRDVATVIGALGGAAAGQYGENRYGETRPGQHIIARLDNGVHVAVTQPADPALRIGDPVYIEGSGQTARVLRR